MWRLCCEASDLTKGLGFPACNVSAPFWSTTPPSVSPSGSRPEVGTEQKCCNHWPGWPHCGLRLHSKVIGIVSSRPNTLLPQILRPQNHPNMTVCGPPAIKSVSSAPVCGLCSSAIYGRSCASSVYPAPCASRRGRSDAPVIRRKTPPRRLRVLSPSSAKWSPGSSLGSWCKSFMFILRQKSAPVTDGLELNDGSPSLRSFETMRAPRHLHGD